MEFVPRRSAGITVGASTTLAMLALTGALVSRLLATPVSVVSFVLGVSGALTVVAAILFIYWTLGCLRLKYALDGSSLTIRWGPVKHIIPLGFVERTLAGDEVGKRPRVRGLNWIGYHIGSAELASIGPVVFFSTHRSLRELVYVVTPGLSYGISPPDPRSFLEQLANLREQPSDSQTRPRAERWSFLRLPIWKDRYAQLIIAAGLLFNAALFAYVTYYFPSLPELLPMHFTVFGDVDLIGFRSEVLKLPTMALVVLTSNLILGVALHAKERVAAYLCLVSAFFVQVVFWVATVRIVY